MVTPVVMSVAQGTTQNARGEGRAVSGVLTAQNRKIEPVRDRTARIAFERVEPYQAQQPVRSGSMASAEALAGTALFTSRSSLRGLTHLGHGHRTNLSLRPAQAPMVSRITASACIVQTMMVI